VLCFRCHGALGKSLEGLQAPHQPVQEGKCDACHEPHNAPAAALLKVAADEICFGCHDRRTFAYKNVHQPVTQGCKTCHQTHGSNFPALLAQPHQPVADGECFSCHGPHASDYPGLVKTDPARLCFECHEFRNLGPERTPTPGLTHTPVAQGNCLACHRAHIPAAGQPVLLAKPAEQLCRDCHAGLLSGRRVNHPPARDGHCMTCHRPHESAVAGVLVKDQRALCGDCHQLVDQEMGRPSLHRPFVTAMCSACHDPHGGTQKKLLLTRGVDLCMGCHQEIAVERADPRRHRPFVEGRCDLCHAPHAAEQPFLLTAAAEALCVSCHPGRKVMSDTPSAHQNCAVCHHAHGNNEKNFLLQEQPTLCLSCHQINTYWERGVGHAPAVEGDCGSCHDPHAPQKQRAVADLCADCHDLSPTVLNPSHQGIAPGPESCLQCHDPHGGPDRSLTLPVKHAPFVEGDCAACHTGGKP
ncbi:MAG: cytochrome c3 family protein, partial [Desulfuromonadaceae bacterium]